MTHELKIETEYFNAIIKGQKRFELRKNDRGFKVGDYLNLKEYDDGTWTERITRVQVIYMIEDCERFGLMKGYCIMTIKGANFG